MKPPTPPYCTSKQGCSWHVTSSRCTKLSLTRTFCLVWSQSTPLAQVHVKNAMKVPRVGAHANVDLLQGRPVSFLHHVDQRQGALYCHIVVSQLLENTNVRLTPSSALATWCMNHNQSPSPTRSTRSVSLNSRPLHSMPTPSSVRRLLLRLSCTRVLLNFRASPRARAPSLPKPFHDRSRCFNIILTFNHKS